MTIRVHATVHKQSVFKSLYTRKKQKCQNALRDQMQSDSSQEGSRRLKKLTLFLTNKVSWKSLYKLYINDIVFPLAVFRQYIRWLKGDQTLGGHIS